MMSTGNPDVRAQRLPRRAAAVGALTLALLASALPALTAPAASSSTPALVSVVVTASDGVAQAAAAVRAAGGRVLDELPLIGAVSAELPAGATLAPTVTVVRDSSLRVTAAGTDAAAVTSTVRATLGLAATGREGAGVTVGVVDTGVADVADLEGRVAEHVDVTGSELVESDEGTDVYGHGTFIAGLIAGTGATDSRFRGVAPGASIVDIRVADGTGTTNLITVLRGLQAAANPKYGIDVLNLSLSSGSPLPYQVDPLTNMLDALWQRGITVVVPSGNDGPEARTVTSPGVDPMLLTVGGIDENGTAARADDTVAEWSGRGPAPQNVAKPELVAPGKSVVSLAAPDSVVVTENPDSVIDGGYFRGSGTSFSTAIAAGAAAALLTVNSKLTPDGVKSLLVDTTYQATGLTAAGGAGAGGVDLRAALAAAPTADANGNLPGKGKANGKSHKAEDIPGDPAKWEAFLDAVLSGDAEAAARAWAALTPAARAWAARAWADLHGDARAWAARAWAARAWAGGNTEEWAARAWAARAWAARAWAARAWAARAWAGESWSARAWADDEWVARAWAGDWDARAWAARAWAARSWATVGWH